MVRARHVFLPTVVSSDLDLDVNEVICMDIMLQGRVAADIF